MAMKGLLTTIPSATAATLTVHPEGTQDGEKQDTGPREQRCPSRE